MWCIPLSTDDPFCIFFLLPHFFSPPPFHSFPPSSLPLLSCLAYHPGHSSPRTPPTGCGSDRCLHCAVWTGFPKCGPETSPAVALSLQRMHPASKGCPPAGHPDQHLHLLPCCSQGCVTLHYMLLSWLITLCYTALHAAFSVEHTMLHCITCYS